MIEEWFVHENVSYLSNGLFVKLRQTHIVLTIFAIACDVVYSTSELILSHS